MMLGLNILGGHRNITSGIMIRPRVVKGKLGEWTEHPLRNDSGPAITKDQKSHRARKCVLNKL